jgi:hypothetical protein
MKSLSSISDSVPVKEPETIPVNCAIPHELLSVMEDCKAIARYSWIECHSCGAKIDADFNAAYNSRETTPTGYGNMDI